ncbi:L-idonate 5-dehydrogenase (plasmid) [Microvirga ossetica]|uniref:L-idonate 5-dehydrogenase n=1 Tax=Microvirga ossetica TaxID=1882682 RepID=A0A1B2ES44_9HYPH|nr:L-idonate 5-dehydrogenase [Microvirga ossetica]ANY82794.1 L-idonate 5-dehydrogenase [Microvirga ossetica]
MRGVIIHGPKDLRVEEVTVPPLGPHDVRVRIEAGGICGSDLHYYNHGGFGTVRVQEPMALGHEIAGTIDEVGSDVSLVSRGMRVAVNPSQPCNDCRYCRSGQHNQCLNMRFMGSAMRFPHVQGGFRERITVDEGQAIPIAPAMTMSEAAMAEPLAVCLHAARQAGSLLGAKVLVTGCGPIGTLAVVAARYAGASEIVATDVSSYPLSIASQVGATKTINVAEDPQGLAPYTQEKGTFDVLFEASGNEAALRGALDALRPGAVIVQLGLGGDMKLPINVIVAKELQIRGTFRFDEEFRLAVDLMGKGLVDVKPLLSQTIPFERAVDAFTLASDRSQAMKVQLTF